MTLIWQNLMLYTLPLRQWLGASYVHHLVGWLQRWRRGSWLMQWADWIGFGLITLVFGLSPFVNNALVGLLLAASAAYWVLLTVTDGPEADTSAVEPERVSVLATPIHLLVLLYWAISVVATAFSPVKQAALAGLTKLTLYLMLFALLARLLRSPRLRTWLLTVYLHAALLVSVYGIRQWFSGAQALATWVDPESPLSKTTRVYSFLGNPNLLAAYLLPAVVFSIVAMFAWRRWLPKLLAATMVVVNGSCMVLTFSRGGWIGLVLAAMVLLLLLGYWFSAQLPGIWRTWTVPILLGAGTALLVVAIAAVEPLRDRASSMFVGRGDSSNNFRINVWMSVIEMIKARPILGIGPGNTAFNKIYPLYQRPRFSALSAYSIPLEIAVETGMIGLLCFIWLLLSTLTTGWNTLQRLRDMNSQDGYWLIGAIATLFGMLGHGLVDTVWYRPQVNMLWWLAIALIASFYTRRPSGETRSSTEA